MLILLFPASCPLAPALCPPERRCSAVAITAARVRVRAAQCEEELLGNGRRSRRRCSLSGALTLARLSWHGRELSGVSVMTS